jgi:hypothetical protein
MAQGLAGADCQQDFLAEGILELLELERGFALITKHLEHRRTTLFRYFYTAILEMDDVHLQRFDLKVTVIATVGTGQRHENSLQTSS